MIQTAGSAHETNNKEKTMTRGTLAAITYNEKFGFIVASSTEFNGDMGFDMSEGRVCMEKMLGLKNIDEFKQHVWNTIYRFSYNDEYAGPSDPTILQRYELKNRAGDAEDNPWDMSGDKVLERTFNFSDYEYIINCSDKPFFFKDRAGKLCAIEPNGEEVSVLNYCSYIGSLKLIDGEKVESGFCFDDDDEEEDK